MLRQKRHHESNLSSGSSTSSKLARPKAVKTGANPGCGRSEEAAVESQQQSSHFLDILSKAGYTLSHSGQANELNVDQTVFQKELLKLLMLHPAYPAVVEEFVEALLSHLETPLRLRQCLVATTTSKDCATARSEKQENLIRILLGVDLVQMPLMCALLEKLPELAAFEQCNIFDSSQISENLPALIVAQFRWLDRVVDSKKLCDKMMELIPLVSVEVQKEMIAALPDIINDQEHHEAAQKLCELLDNQELNVTVLDALSNLNIHPDVIAEVKQKVMKTLQSVPLEHLPVLVSFILQNTGQQDAVKTVSDLRSNLEFMGTIIPLSASTPIVQEQKSVGLNKGVDFLVIEALQLVFRFQRHIADAWLKAIEMVETVEHHKPLDFLVLLVLDSLEVRRRFVESLLRNKIRSEKFAEELINVTFSSHFVVVKEYFPSVLRLADILLKSIEPVFSSFGSAIYHKAFVVSESYCRQQVMENLITHIGSGSILEVNSALSTMTILVKNYPESVARFGTYIKNMLEYIDILQLSQIRKVYEMLAIVAYQGGHDGLFLQDDIQILINKQLTNTNLKYQQMGVIGSLMTVKAISLSANSTRGISAMSADSTIVNGNDSMTPNQKVAASMLSVALRYTSRNPEVLALFFDELSRLFHRSDLDTCIEGWMLGAVVDSFTSDFVLDIVPDVPLPVCSALDLQLRFDLDHHPVNEDTIAINLMLYIIKEDWSKSGKNEMEGDASIRNLKNVSPLILAPQLRLLRICEVSQKSGSVTGINALLGCSVYLSHSDLDDKFEELTTNEKHLLCTGYFYCINWFREVVNAFSASAVNDSEIKLKVVRRLKEIITMQLKLQSFLAVLPNYFPPLVNYDFDCLETAKPAQLPVVNTNAKPKKAPKRAKKGKKKGKAGEGDEGEEIQPTIITPTCRDKSVVEKNVTDEKQATCIDFVSFRPFLRELDLEVSLNLLGSIQIQKQKWEGDVANDDKLSPRELEFLLDDLAQKLSHILFSVKRPSFLKAKSNGRVGFSNLNLYTTAEVVTSMTNMSIAFCQLLEDCSGYFQSLTNENDGVVDGPGMDSTYSKQVASCMLLLLQIFHSLLSWNGFVGENKSLLEEIVSTLGGRIVGNRLTQVPLCERFRRTFKYLENFADSLPSLDCAVQLIKVLESVAEKAGKNELKEHVSMTSEKFLKRNWSTGKKELRGAKYNEKIRSMIQVYLKYSEDSLLSLETVASVAIAELAAAEGKDAASATFLTLSRHTFSSYYSVCLHHLVEVVKLPVDSQETNLLMWNQAIRIFNMLVEFIRVFSGRSNLTSCLKYGRQFVDIFLKLCMPLLDDVFRSHFAEVQGMLKNLQLSTRTLQCLCSHSKVIQDISLTNHVPFLRKSLEFLVYRVKAMLFLNKCKEAFWIGNLKNRNLQGEEILSQQSAISDESDGESGATVEVDGEANESNDENDAGSIIGMEQDEEEDDAIDQSASF